MHEDEFLIDSVISLIHELGRFPSHGDMRVKRNASATFPSPNSIARLGNKSAIVDKVRKRAGQLEFQDVLDICAAHILKVGPQRSEAPAEADIVGEVYLCKSGRYYKIGRTNDLVRRGGEIKIQLLEKLELIHSIKTDDPSGVEAYWHKRFEIKRMNGEWFNLDASEIRSFKRWRSIY